ncbi:MAG: hypothetical protein ABI988_04670 [Nitrospirota bacterium]
MMFTVTITTEEDGAYIAECPAIPGRGSEGKTEASDGSHSPSGSHPQCKVAHGVFNLIRQPVFPPHNSFCQEKTKFFEGRNPAAMLPGMIIRVSEGVEEA